jgi:hypothetical protein
MSLNPGLIKRVVSFKRECKCIICIGFQSFLCMTCSGFSILDGDSLFISNLTNGVDLYSLRTMQRLRHYESQVTVNVPLQIALARHALDRVVLGDARGTLQVYDRATGELVHRLEHTTKGRVQVVDVSLLKYSLIFLLTMVFLGWEYPRGRVHCCCVVCYGSECSNSTLALERVPSGSSG